MRLRFYVVLLFLFGIISFIPFMTSAAQVNAQYLFASTLSGTQYIATTLTQAIALGAFTSAVALSLLGILLSFLLIAISYILDSVFNIPSLKGWYKGEIRETIKSIIIVVVIFSVIIIMGNIAISDFSVGNIAPLNGINQITTTTEAMYNAVEVQYLGAELNDVNASLIGLFGLYDGLGVLKTTTLAIYVPIPVLPLPEFYIGSIDFGVKENLYTSSVLGSTNIPDAGLTTDIGKVVVLPMLILFQVEADVFPYVIIAGLTVLLPAGIILRSVPLLRSIGGTLIALGIGTAIVYPALLLLMNLPLTNFIAPPVQTGTTPPFNCATITNGVASASLTCGFLNSAVSTTQSYLSSIPNSQPLTNNIQYALSGFVAGVSSLTSIYPALNFITSQMYINLIYQFILSILDIIIGFTITQNIAKMLGGNVKLGIGRLKLA